MSYKNVDVGSDGGAYYKLQDGVNRCRIVSDTLEVWTSFDEENKTATKFLDPKMAQAFNAKQTDDRKTAKKRFALWVIDRADGKTKLAEVAPSIMGQIVELANDKDYEFDVIPPYDIKITKTGMGLQTRYSVLPAPASVLTAEETAHIATLQTVLDFMRTQKGVIDATETQVVQNSVPTPSAAPSAPQVAKMDYLSQIASATTAEAVRGIGELIQMDTELSATKKQVLMANIEKKLETLSVEVPY